MAKYFSRISDVASSPRRKGRYPVSRATLWRWVAAGTFPKPVKLSPGVTAWDNDDLDAYDAARGVKGAK
ncbi:AlpA family phage regulatory protein [Massilia sp. H-1]|nr:AlpA family phage regulatory protein [Massilia sp. H-1]